MAAPDPVLTLGRSTGPGMPVAVSPERIAAFAGALGIVFAARATPTAEAPPTLVVALALENAGGPVDLLAPLVRSGAVGGVLHGDQQLTVHRPVRAGDTLVFTSVVETVRRLPGSTVTAIATAVAAAGERVADLRATFVLTDPAVLDTTPA